ncbi:MAG: COG1470 family protein, partial [Rhodothermales bacterium]
SQMSGRYREVTGPYLRYYERMDATVEAPEEETTFFDSLDTSLPGLFSLLGVTAPPEALALLEDVQARVEKAIAAFDLADPAAVVPTLAQGLSKTRQALALVEDQPDVRFHLQIKERQFMDAINTALGVRLEAIGVPGGAATSESPWAPLPTMGLAVPGQTLGVEVALVNPSPLPVQLQDIRLVAAGNVTIPDVQPSTESDSLLERGAQAQTTFQVTLPEDATPSAPYFSRDSIQESRYTVQDSASLHLPQQTPPLTAVAEYTVEGVPVEVHATVRTREAQFPYGYELRALKIAPALAVNVAPAMRIVPVAKDPATEDSASFSVAVDLVSNREDSLSGELRLDVPEGWRVDPSAQPFSFSGPGQEQRFTLQVTPTRLEASETYTLEAVAEAEGQAYRQGYDAIAHRDNDTQYLYRPAITRVRGVDVQMAPDLEVGYVMGVGDEVPAGIEQLGADVQLLDADALASADLAQYDAIVIGTRAYAVRPDLRTSNPRLLEYARQGGNLIVLYQTSEFVPGEMAPYPATLPPGAEEVSEEDADVRILAPDHPALHQPNAITPSDFDGWVEQRGSKFFSEWDSAYTPMLEMQDQGQAPQQGAWLTAEYGDGHYSYFALAVHRQLPYAVPGAYRLFANLLSLE